MLVVCSQFILSVYACPRAGNSLEFDYLRFVFEQVPRDMTYSIHKVDLFIVSIKIGVKGHAKLVPELFSSSLKGLCFETAEGVELGDPVA